MTSKLAKGDLITVQLEPYDIVYGIYLGELRDWTVNSTNVVYVLYCDPSGNPVCQRVNATRLTLISTGENDWKEARA